jgi:acetylornithine deacetylase
MVHPPLAGVEAAVVAAIQQRESELVDLAGRLVAFDTTARLGDEPARDERELQELLARRLEAAGAQIDLWEPSPDSVAEHSQVPDGFGFAGRPQLIARRPGRARDRALLFNGHVDAVPVEPIDRWTSHPHRPELRDGRLYGRGACDMKGGVAAMVFAVETLAELGVETPADVLVNTVTDEETWGAGTLASLARGLRADAAIVPEPTDRRIVVACRGILNLTVTVAGRPAHATMRQPDWREGGAVNAIEKAAIVVQAAQALREDWARRPDLRHEHLPSPVILPTLIDGGEWKVSYPASCQIFFDIAYLPTQADEQGTGSRVRAEIERWIGDAVRCDPWLAANPITFEWGLDLPPGETSPDAPIVTCARDAVRATGATGALGGLDAWHDAASLIRVGGIPSVDLGPATVDGNGRPLMHAVDEHVAVADLVATAQALALAAMRFR